MAHLLRELGELLFPAKCQVCSCFCRSPICAACAEAFELIHSPLCERCGCPFDPQAVSRPHCADCASHRRALEAARSVGLHVGRLREAVNALKFRGRMRLGAPLGRLLAGLLDRDGGPACLPLANPLTGIVPVPLHPSRRRERGFDQAELLSDALSEITRLPVRRGLLVRIRNTPPQVDLAPRERRENVRGAFDLRYPVPAGAVHALLVDDVYTTGATLEECARTLRRGGAAAVQALTVTRAPPAWHRQADLVGSV